MNTKGDSLGRKYKREKMPTENKPQTTKKMVMGSYISLITLNINGINSPTQRHRLAGQMKKKNACMQFHVPLTDHCLVVEKELNEAMSYSIYGHPIWTGHSGKF